MFCAKVVLYCNNRKFIAMALSSNRKKLVTNTFSSLEGKL